MPKSRSRATAPALRGVAASLTWLACAAIALGACSFTRSDHPDACSKKVPCEKKGFTCSREGFCVKGDGGMSDKPTTDAGKDKPDSGAGMTGAKCDADTPKMDCYDGAPETEDVGMCRGGQRVCVNGTLTDCIAQTVPAEETCNGKDDDCDGKTDEITMGECETQMSGVCNTGALHCRGMYPVCEPVDLPKDEQCNGKDDDCDGKTDEIMSDEPCYPKDEAGCEFVDGVVKCAGLCKPGLLACKSGKSSCVGAETPAKEKCNTGSGLATDENCDGRIDEDCPCTTGAERPCYTGPANTEGEGECKRGKQTCFDEKWGACEGEVVSEAETCINSGQDNDCNGTKDDVPKLGTGCNIEGKYAHGICLPGTYRCTDGAAPECVSNLQPTDEACDPDGEDTDCDGDPSNGFHLDVDDNNCGMCGNRCDPRRASCCEASCHELKDFEQNPQNCGECGKICNNDQFCCQGGCVNVDRNGGPKQIPGPGSSEDDQLCLCEVKCQDGEVCCGKECVNLAKDKDNCGACGHSCSNILGGSGSCCGNACCPLL